MILTNFYHSWLYLKKNPLFSLINIIGLVISITSALVIFIYASYETSYDRFHADYEDIYRVLGVDQAQSVGITMPAVGPAMEASIPGVMKAVRISHESPTFVLVGDRMFDVKDFVRTTDSFFEVFNFPLLQRSGAALLDRPHSAVLTEAFAEKLFGNEPALGKLLTFEGQQMEVVGVMQDNRPDSHMQFELLLGLNYLSPQDEGAEEIQTDLDSWDQIEMVTYAKLAPGADAESVEAQLNSLIAERRKGSAFSAALQPIAEAHLNSSGFIYDDFNQNKGDAEKVLMLNAIALSLLVIAACNFMNLSTARSALRAKEVGVRKVSGATRLKLIMQFMQESVLLVFVSAAVGVLLISILNPLIELPLLQNAVAYLLSDKRMVLRAIVALLLLAVLGGFYPAFMLSSFAPVKVLTGKFLNSARGIWLRRGLVIVQFALSGAIIVGMLVVYRQIEFLKNSELGFEPEGIVNITLGDEALEANYAALRNELGQIPQVQSVAGASTMPGKNFFSFSIRLPEAAADDSVRVRAMVVDEPYLDTLAIKLAAGRQYSAAATADAAESIMLNQAAAAALGWTDEAAIGQVLRTGPITRTVVGVVEDFHIADMRSAIEPLVLYHEEGDAAEVAVRIDISDIGPALIAMEAAWDKVNPNYPFSYTLLSDAYSELLKDDEAFSATLVQFTFVAIVISCLGLYGLTAFSAEQKTKEVGIRKVLGADLRALLKVVLQEYLLLLIVATAVAWGLAWFAMQQWLSGFAYRIELSISSFVLAAIGTALLALLTISAEIFKMLRARPVTALRYE